MRMTIKLTPVAVTEAKRKMAKENKKNIGLRMLVKGGGCSGLSYALNYDEKKTGDHVFEFEELEVYVDPKSFLYLDGTTLDFDDSLQGKGFQFVNPNADKTCGCGESFSV